MSLWEMKMSRHNIQPYAVKRTTGGFIKVESRRQISDIERIQTDYRVLSWHQSSQEAHKARVWWKNNKDVLLVKYGARQNVPLIPPWAKDPKWFDK